MKKKDEEVKVEETTTAFTVGQQVTFVPENGQSKMSGVIEALPNTSETKYRVKLETGELLKINACYLKGVE